MGGSILEFFINFRCELSNSLRTIDTPLGIFGISSEWGSIGVVFYRSIAMSSSTVCAEKNSKLASEMQRSKTEGFSGLPSGDCFLRNE